jgi:WD40 repeat protein
MARPRAYSPSTVSATIYALDWSRRSNRLAVGALNGEVDVWDGATGQLVARFTDQRSIVGTVAWSPTHADLLATGGNDLVIRIYDVARRRPILDLRGHTAPLRGLAWSPDGSQLASAGNDGSVRLWDLARGVEIYRYTQHTGQVAGVAWAPDGQFSASSGEDTTVRIWWARP